MYLKKWAAEKYVSAYIRLRLRILRAGSDSTAELTDGHSQLFCTEIQIVCVLTMFIEYPYIYMIQKNSSHTKFFIYRYIYLNFTG